MISGRGRRISATRDMPPVPETLHASWRPVAPGPAVARRLVLALAALLVLPPIPAGAQQTGGSPVRKRTAYEDLQMFGQVLNQIRANHPDSVDTHTLIMAAIEGMLHAADPHSYVVTALRLDPQKEKAFREGRMYPVPIAFTFVGGSPVVVGIAPGSAAARSDILPGDELIAIDGQPVAAMSAAELDVTLAGERNSTVSLTVERRRSDGSLARLERAVKRERIGDLTAVPAAFMLDARTGYLRITAFENARVSDDVHAALRRLERQGMQRLVLDLRDNPGGMVEEAAKVAGEFLPKGTILYTQEGRKSDVADTGRVGRSFWSREKRYPIVVMINQGSASAAELVAGALQDHDRALLVGRPSFGKSLVMHGFPLTDGSVAVLVVGHMKTPCGRVIQRQYREVTRRDYYRLALAERDTAGRPHCTTAGGRVVYGGGGIVPDVLLPAESPRPVWLARLHENGLPLQWIGGHLEANVAAYPSLDALAAAPSVTPAAMADFRRFAREQGVVIPDGADADRLLQRTLVLAVARARWDQEGYYRLAAVLDPRLADAVAAFEQADLLLAR